MSALTGAEASGLGLLAAGLPACLNPLVGSWEQNRLATGRSCLAGSGRIGLAAAPLFFTASSAGNTSPPSPPRTRRREQEAARLHQVLHHPQFLADPLAAVRNHLSATLPAAPAAPPRPKAPGAKLPRSEKKRRQKANRAAAAAMQEGD